MCRSCRSIRVRSADDRPAEVKFGGAIAFYPHRSDRQAKRTADRPAGGKTGPDADPGGIPSGFRLRRESPKPPHVRKGRRDYESQVYTLEYRHIVIIFTKTHHFRQQKPRYRPDRTHGPPPTITISNLFLILYINEKRQKSHLFEHPMHKFVIYLLSCCPKLIAGRATSRCSPNQKISTE